MAAPGSDVISSSPAWEVSVESGNGSGTVEAELSDGELELDVSDRVGRFLRATSRLRLLLFLKTFLCLIGAFPDLR